MSQRPPRQSIPLLRARMQQRGYSYQQVWERCFTFGSTLDRFDFEAIMDQALVADSMNQAYIAHAVWELEQGWA